LNGVLKLERQIASAQRLENACRIANESNLYSCRHIKTILKNSMHSISQTTPLTLIYALTMNMFGVKTVIISGGYSYVVSASYCKITRYASLWHVVMLYSMEKGQIIQSTRS